MQQQNTTLTLYITEEIITKIILPYQATLETHIAIIRSWN
jgi:hypothetical protein